MGETSSAPTAPPCWLCGSARFQLVRGPKNPPALEITQLLHALLEHPERGRGFGVIDSRSDARTTDTRVLTCLSASLMSDDLSFDLSV